MNEETLARALGGLRAARMSEAASDRVREELETAWRDRAEGKRRRTGFVVPGIARAFAIAAVVVIIGFGTLRASADNPLYAARVVVEDALVAFQADPVAYVGQLYEERLEEAARFEAAGNALAAGRARNAKENALRLLRQLSPQLQEPSPEPTPSSAITLPTPSPSPEPTAEPTEPPTPEPTGRTPVPVVRTPTPKPATPKPPTPKPTVKVTSPTPTPMTVHATGDVLYSDGSRVNGACVSLTLNGTCIAGTVNGKVDVWLTAKKGQTITLYFENYDAARGGTLRGKVSVTVGGPEVLLGTITLRPG